MPLPAGSTAAQRLPEGPHGSTSSAASCRPRHQRLISYTGRALLALS